MGFFGRFLMDGIPVNLDHHDDPLVNDNEVWFKPPIFLAAANKDWQRGKCYPFVL
jgi:hypothetical protein